MDQRADFKEQRYAKKIVADVPRILVPAAEYVRVSDQAQQYSIDNQKAAIGEYAFRNGFDVGQDVCRYR
jgi:hypothetical protein